MSQKKIWSALILSLLMCSLGGLAFSCGDKGTHFVYYESEIALDKTYDEFGSSIELYEPKVLGYQFEGWWLDDDYTQKAPTNFSTKDLHGQKFVRVFAKFSEKRISNIEIVGKVKDSYEYGENFDSSGAKINVSYVNSDLADEVFPITDKMVSYFYTVDENVDLQDLDTNDHTFTQNMRIGVDYCYQSVEYVVYSDLRDLEFDGKLIYLHGFHDFDSVKSNVTAEWTDLLGNSGSTEINENNGSTSNMQSSRLGLDTTTLRFHFRDAQVETEVVANKLFTKGEIEGTIFLNEYTDLTSQLISLKSGTTRATLTVDYDDIVTDIDTSAAGDHIAKIKYGEKVIEVAYSVVDLSQAKRITLVNQLFVGDAPKKYLEFQAEMSDGKIVNFTIGQDVISAVDTSSKGEKTAEATYYDTKFTFDYYVVNVDDLTEGEIKTPYWLGQFVYGMEITFTADDYAFTLRVYPYNSDGTKILTDVDTSSVGTKYAQIELRGKKISVKYTVE